MSEFGEHQGAGDGQGSGHEPTPGQQGEAGNAGWQIGSPESGAQQGSAGWGATVPPSAGQWPQHQQRQHPQQWQQPPQWQQPQQWQTQQWQQTQQWPPPSGQWPPQGGQWPQAQQWPGHAAPQHRPKRPLSLLLGVVGLVALIGIGFAAWGITRAASTPSVATLQTPQTPQTSALDPASIAAKVNPALVDVNTVLGYQGGQAAGTGIVLTSNGEILTNNHVVAGATQIQVTDIGNGQTYQASVVGYDRTQDIAVLQLQGASGLATATTGSSSGLAVGDQVVGIGNAGGTGGTPSVAAGAITALNQSITATDQSGGNAEQLSGLIQVNANIQAGDSGGPLVNTSGQVIGVDTAASANNPSTGQGISSRGKRGNSGPAAATQGFAIPINQALTIAHQIVSSSASSTVHIGDTPMMGVSVSDASAPGAATTVSGAAVQQVLSGGPAAQAGLTAGDLITSLGGQTVDSATTLTTLMEQHHPGDNVSVTWVDQSQQQHTATVQLATGPVG